MSLDQFEMDLNRSEGNIPDFHCLGVAKFKLYLDAEKDLKEDIEIYQIKVGNHVSDENHFKGYRKSPYYKWALDQVQKYATHSSDIYTFDKYYQNDKKVVRSTQHIF